MLQKIDNWLKDSKRDYASGLSFFNKLASADMQTKYGAFLNSADLKDRNSLAPRSSILVNKLTAIFNMMRTNPEAFKEVLSIPSGDLISQIAVLDKQGKEMLQQIEELQESEDDKTSEIENLQEQLEKKSEEIEKLVEQLEEQGLKVIVSGSQLPDNLREKYERTKAIIPLMAAIHSELKDTTISDEERKARAEELCKLDDERRKHWDNIDAYLEGKEAIAPGDRQLEYSENHILRGIQIGNRIKHLKQNIDRAKKSIENAQAQGKENGVAKAQRRLEKYESELKELEAQVNEKK